MEAVLPQGWLPMLLLLLMMMMMMVMVMVMIMMFTDQPVVATIIFSSNAYGTCLILDFCCSLLLLCCVKYFPLPLITFTLCDACLPECRQKQDEEKERLLDEFYV